MKFERKYLKRPVKAHAESNSHSQAFEQSRSAIFHLIEDMKKDISSLFNENEKMKELLRIGALPKRGTREESMSFEDFSSLVLSSFSSEFLSSDEELPNY